MILVESNCSKLPRISRLTKKTLNFSYRVAGDSVFFKGANPDSLENKDSIYTPAESMLLMTRLIRERKTKSLSKLVLFGYATSFCKYLFSISATFLSVFESFFVEFLRRRAEGPSMSDGLFEVTETNVSYLLLIEWLIRSGSSALSPNSVSTCMPGTSSW